MRKTLRWRAVEIGIFEADDRFTEEMMPKLGLIGNRVMHQDILDATRWNSDEVTGWWNSFEEIAE